jgi:hypothetical protein
MSLPETLPPLSRTQPPRLALWVTSLALLWLAVLGVDAVDPTAAHNYLTVLAWLLSIGAFSYSVLRVAGWRSPSLRQALTAARAHQLEILGVAGLGALALGLRVYMLTTHPYAFIHDEGSMGQEAVNLLNGTRTDLFGVGWSSNPMWAFLPFALSVKLLGNTILAVRMVSAVEGALTVIMVYLMAREAFGCPVAFFAAGALVALPLHLHFSRLGVGNIVDGFLGALVFWLLLRAIRRGGLADYLWAGLAGGLTVYVYLGSRLVVALAAALLLYLILRRRGFLRAHFMPLMVFGAAIVIVTLPMASFFLRHPDEFMSKINTEGILQNGWLQNEMTLTGQSAPQVLLGQVFKASLVYVARGAPAGFFNSPQPYLTLLAAVFFVLGMGYALARLGEPAYLLVLAWFWAVVVFGGALTVGVPASQRLIQSAPGLAILIGLGLYKTAEAFSRLGLVPRRLGLALCVGVLAVNAVQDADFYFNRYRLGLYFEDANNELALLVSERAKQLGSRYRLFLLGEPRILVSYPNFGYLAPEVEKHDFNVVTAEALAALPRDRGAFFAALPDRRADLEEIARQLPGGEWREVPRRNYAEPCYLAYLLTPQQFASSPAR